MSKASAVGECCSGRGKEGLGRGSSGGNSGAGRAGPRQRRPRAPSSPPPSRGGAQAGGAASGPAAMAAAAVRRYRERQPAGSSVSRGAGRGRQRRGFAEGKPMRKWRAGGRGPAPALWSPGRDGGGRCRGLAFLAPSQPAFLREAVRYRCCHGAARENSCRSALGVRLQESGVQGGCARSPKARSRAWREL